MWCCMAFSLVGPGHNSRSAQEGIGRLKRKIDSSAVELALSSFQMVISRPVALFDLYAAIAALDKVVNIAKNKKDDRATRFEIVLRQCDPLINNPGLQQILIKLVTSKRRLRW